MVIGLHFSDNFIALCFLFCFDLSLVLILLQTRITLANDSFDLGKFPGLLLDTHPALLIRRQRDSGGAQLLRRRRMPSSN
jgi:hypothetical protein